MYDKMRNLGREHVKQKSIVTGILEASSDVLGHLLYVTFHAITGGILMTMGHDDAEYVRYNQAAIVYSKTKITDVGQVITLELVGTWNIVQMCAVFNLITMMTHIWYLYQRFVYDRPFYSVNFRWFEYSITAPLMIMNVAILSGVRDVFVLVTIAGAMSVTQYFGYLADQCYLNDWMSVITVSSPFGIAVGMVNLKNPFWYGVWPYLFSWVPIFSMFFITTSETEEIPTFVYSVIFFTFTIFSMFAIVQWIMIVSKTREDAYSEIKSSKKENMELYDGAMHILSITSKVTLSWMVYFGVSSMASS